MMKVLKYLPDIISYFLFGLTICGLFLVFRWVNHQLDDSEDYQTTIIEETTRLNKISVKLHLWEKLYKAKSKPKIIYKDIKDDFKIPDETVYYLKKTPHEIHFRTISDSGKKAYTHPAYVEFEYIAPDNIIYHRNWFDWNKLSISVLCCFEQETEIKLYSSLRFNPWAIKIQPYVSNRGTGIEIRKKLW